MTAAEVKPREERKPRRFMEEDGATLVCVSVVSDECFISIDFRFGSLQRLSFLPYKMGLFSNPEELSQPFHR